MHVLKADAATSAARLRARRYVNCGLLSIDEIGFRPLDRMEANLFFRLVSTRYERLAQGELTVSELAAPYHMSLAAASKHIQTLERVGLVKRTVRGRVHYCRIDPRPLARADDWLRRYERLWDTRLERLVALLRHPDNHPSDAE